MVWTVRDGRHAVSQFLPLAHRAPSQPGTPSTPWAQLRATARRRLPDGEPCDVDVSAAVPDVAIRTAGSPDPRRR
jgi:hypothetical protein